MSETSDEDTGQGEDDTTNGESPGTRLSPALRMELFKDLADERRSTEQKSIILTGQYLALIAISTSLFTATSLANAGSSDQVLRFFAFLLAGSISLVVFGLQRWYRMWKMHYVGVSRALASTFEIDEYCLPIWLRRDAPASHGHIKALESWLHWFSLTLAIVFFVFSVVAVNNLPGISGGNGNVVAGILALSELGAMVVMLIGLRRKGSEITAT